MPFAACQLQEKCQEQHGDLFVTYVDLNKAFDTVSRDGLWKIVEKFGCRPSISRGHDGDDGSEALPVTKGLKQGCALPPTFFSMVFSAMLTDAFMTARSEYRSNTGPTAGCSTSCA